MKASEAAKNALQNVLEAESDEKIVIICDEEKTKVGEAFVTGAIKLDLWTRLFILQKMKKPRTEIPDNLQNVLAQKPDIYINILKGNRLETPFRTKLIKTETQDRKSRLGHCPGITFEMLTEGALALTNEEHVEMQKKAQHLMNILEDTITVELSNPSGTNLTLHTRDRKFFTDTKLDWQSMKWMNLPTGEVIVAPEEESANGILVCDMAIGGIGKLEDLIEVRIKNGRAEEMFTNDKELENKVRGTFATDFWAEIVGEFAFGINSKARFVDQFLEAEKMVGTVHVAFGANTDMPGGKNRSVNHMDFLMSKPTVKITKKDGEPITILNKGSYEIQL